MHHEEHEAGSVTGSRFSIPFLVFVSFVVN